MGKALKGYSSSVRRCREFHSAGILYSGMICLSFTLMPSAFWPCARPVNSSILPFKSPKSHSIPFNTMIFSWQVGTIFSPSENNGGLHSWQIRSESFAQPPFLLNSGHWEESISENMVKYWQLTLAGLALKWLRLFWCFSDIRRKWMQEGPPETNPFLFCHELGLCLSLFFMKVFILS